MSGNCYKARLAARQVGVALSLKDYGLHDGATRKPDYLAKNPNGRVPMLEFEDGRTLAESGAILWYLGENTPLVPADPWGRAQLLQWMFFEQYSHEPYIAVARFWLGYAPKEDLEKRRHLVPEWHAKGNAALGVMQRHLAKHDCSRPGNIRLPTLRYTATPIARPRAASSWPRIRRCAPGWRVSPLSLGTFRCPKSGRSSGFAGGLRLQIAVEPAHQLRCHVDLVGARLCAAARLELRIAPLRRVCPSRHHPNGSRISRSTTMKPPSLACRSPMARASV
jgi:glutathione S-transferase